MLKRKSASILEPLENIPPPPPLENLPREIPVEELPAPPALPRDEAGEKKRRRMGKMRKCTSTRSR